MDIEGLESRLCLDLEDSVGFFLDYITDSTQGGFKIKLKNKLAAELANLPHRKKIYQLKIGRLYATSGKDRLELCFSDQQHNFGMVFFHDPAWPLFFSPVIDEKVEESTYIGIPGVRLGYALRQIDKHYFNILTQNSKP